jgi:hypothetical protein
MRRVTITYSKYFQGCLSPLEPRKLPNFLPWALNESCSLQRSFDSYRFLALCCFSNFSRINLLIGDFLTASLLQSSEFPDSAADAAAAQPLCISNENQWIYDTDAI